MSEVEKERARLYKALSHPIRIGIVRILGERDLSSFTEFKNALEIGDAKLYYHLGMLRGLIAQDKELKYFLTEQGRLAYRLLLSEKEAPMKTLGKEARGGWIGLFHYYMNMFLLPRWLISYLFGSPLRNAVELSLAILMGSWAASVSGLKPALLLLTYDPDHPQFLIMAEFVYGWLLVYGLSDIFSSLLGGRGNHLNLFVGVTLSRVPIVLFSLLWMLDRTFRWGVAFLYGGMPIRILMLVCQAWSLSLLTLATSLAKRLPIEKAAVVTLVLTYLNLAFYVATQGF